MKNVILPAKAISAAILCQATKDIRYFLCGVFVSDKLIIGTNSHVMFRCHHGSFNNGMNRGDFSEGGAIISFSRKPPSAAKHAKLNDIDGEKGIVEYYKTVDRDSKPIGDPIQSDVYRYIDGAFPDTEQTIARSCAKLEKVSKYRINPTYMGLADKVFKLVSPNREGCLIEFYGKLSACRVSRNTKEMGLCEMLIMPMSSIKEVDRD